MWDSYLHNITIHFPIVMSMVLAAVGVWYVRSEADTLRDFIRFGGAITLGITLVAAVSGLLTAQMYWTEEGPEVLIHHRNLGLLLTSVMIAAVGCFEYGVRKSESALKKLGALLWIACVLAAVGVGHWGGSGVHSDTIPWQKTPPVLVTPEIDSELR